MGLETSIDILRAVMGSDTEALVRVPGHDPNYLMRVLDAGAESLMIPMVETPEQAGDLVAACRYPTLGKRGFAAPAVRGSRYGMEENYIHEATDRLFIAAQIETAASVERTVEIGAINGIDLLFLGSGDLSGSIGKLAQGDDPEVKALVQSFEDKARGAGIPIGGIPRPGWSVGDLGAAGWMMAAGGVDTMMLRDAGLADIQAFRGKVAAG